MQFRKDDKGGNQLSVLGFGCMRLPGNLGRINKDKTEELIMKAYRNGVNYFDTAYLYPGSETVLGEILKKSGIRDDVFIATKLPHVLCKSYNDFDKYFEIQKKRLQTDCIDYYLIHNVSSFDQWDKVRDLGIEKWIAEKKKSGEIKNVGFSYHGTKNDFPIILDSFDWDFVQIQYNYININYQAGQDGLKYAAEKGLPVIIMEPLLGGKLADGLPKDALKIMKEAKPDSTAASWALNWLWDQPEVTVILSGMNQQEQLDENLALAETAGPGFFGDKEAETIEEVIKVFNESYRIRCTGCNYCMPCPQKINIPACFTAYNTSYSISWFAGVTQYMNTTGLIGDSSSLASDCINCGKCVQHCPQEIKIPEELKQVKRKFEFPGIKGVAAIARKVMS